jgi:hypothetical protein
MLGAADGFRKVYLVMRNGKVQYVVSGYGVKEGNKRAKDSSFILV